MGSVIEIAETVVAKIHEQGDAVTQLKLHKLLYYVQGWAFALETAPRFKEAIEAWEFGPVIHSVRQHFGSFGRGPITLDREIYPSDDLLIDCVIEFYGQHSAESLVALTHKDEPWQKHYQPFEDRKIIPDSDIEDYFRQRAASTMTVHAGFLDHYRAKKHDVVEGGPTAKHLTPSQITEVRSWCGS